MKKMIKRIAIMAATIAIMLVSSLPAFAAENEKPITNIAFPTSVTLKVGEAKTLEVIPTPSDTTHLMNIQWGNQTNGTFSVKPNGFGTYWGKPCSETITGLEPGKGYLNTTVEVFDSGENLIRSYKVSTTVTVVDSNNADSNTTPTNSDTTEKRIPLKKITLNKTALELTEGASSQLSVNYTPSNTTDIKTVSWISSNYSVVSVSGGRLTAKKAGLATITARVGGKISSCKITVKPKPIPLQSIKLSKTSATITAGSSAQLSVTYNPANTTDSKAVTWKSSNTGIATVSGGKVTAKKAGTATITAKVGSKSATCKITVKAAASTAASSGYVNVSACYTKINQYRKNAGVSSLKQDATLEKYAKTRAKELVTKFSHTRPNGKDGLTIISGNKNKGENIAMGYDSCASVMTGWYNSSGHRRNMLDRSFTKVGIAGYNYKGTIYWVQLFSN